MISVRDPFPRFLTLRATRAVPTGTPFLKTAQLGQLKLVPAGLLRALRADQ